VISYLRRGLTLKLPAGTVVTLVTAADGDWTCQQMGFGRRDGTVFFTARFLARFGRVLNVG
jgi:hypothetical protein